MATYDEYIELRTATISDCGALVKFGIDAFLKTFGRAYPPEAVEKFIESDYNIDIFREWVGDPKYCVWIAICGGAIIGYSVAAECMLPIPFPSHSDGEIKKVYVDPHFENSHVIAYELFSLSLNWLKSKYEHVYLSVYEENIQAQQFYMNFGFQVMAKCDSEKRVVLLQWCDANVVPINTEMNSLNQLNNSNGNRAVNKPKRKPPPPPPPSASMTMETPAHDTMDTHTKGRYYTEEEKELLTLLDIGIVDFNAYTELESPHKISNRKQIFDGILYANRRDPRQPGDANTDVSTGYNGESDLMPSVEIPI